MRNLIAFLIASVLSIPLFITETTAHQLPCMATSPAEFLEKEHGEKLLTTLVTKGGHLLLLYANPENNNWSLVLHVAEINNYCAIDNGTDLTFPDSKPSAPKVGT